MSKSIKSKSKRAPSRKSSEKTTDKVADEHCEKKFTEHEKREIESNGMVMTNFDVPLGQKSKQVSASKYKKNAKDSHKIEPLIVVDNAGNYSTPLLKSKRFSSLTDLLDSI